MPTGGGGGGAGERKVAGAFGALAGQHCGRCDAAASGVAAAGAPRRGAGRWPKKSQADSFLQERN